MLNMLQLYVLDRPPDLATTLVTLSASTEIFMVDEDTFWMMIEGYELTCGMDWVRGNAKRETTLGLGPELVQRVK
jgi:hypothetical protein